MTEGMASDATMPAEGATVEPNVVPNPAEGSAVGKADKAKPDAVSRGVDGIDKAIKDAALKAKGDVKAKESAAKDDTEDKDKATREGDRRRKVDKSLKDADAKLKGEAGDEADGNRSSNQDPPARFSEGAKAEWQSLPEQTKGEVHRAIRELEQGHHKYKASAEHYDTHLRQYDELARRNGRAGVHESLQQVVQLEQAFQRSPIEGVAKIADHFGFSPQALAKAILQEPPEARERRNAAAQQAQMQQMQLAIAQQQNQMRQEMATNQIMTSVASFAAAHADFNKLEDDIIAEINAGAPNLEEAYERAKKRKAPNPAGQKSISGAPSTTGDPSVPARKKGEGGHKSIDDALKRAQARLAS